MSDTPQGPGWWLASDGRWYPPQTTTQVPPPPASPGYGGMPSKPGTNGLAIASLVLGILWICGVGSLLALILGIVALSQIRKTASGGKGLAIAGIVLGSLGVLATGGTAIAVALAADNVKFNEPDEFNDVEITRCGVKETASKPSVDVRITNDSSKRSNYLVVVKVTGSDSKTFDLALSSLGPVAAHGSDVFTITASGDTTSAQGPFNCSLSKVNRFAG